MIRTAFKSVIVPVIAGVLGFSLVYLTETPAACAGCGPGHQAGVQRSFQAFDEQCGKQLGDRPLDRTACFRPNIYNKVLPIMKALGKDNRFGPGDQVFFPGDSKSGTAASAGTSFQSAAPLDRDSVTVRISIGGGPAAVRLCAVSLDGSIRTVGSLSFSEADNHTEKAVTATALHGKVLRIYIIGPARKLQFNLVTG